MPAACLTGCAFETSYGPGLVTLSVVLAALASHVALDLAGRTSAATGRSQLAWLTGGSLVLGVGIWSMHFIGMLALHVHAPAGLAMAHAHAASGGPSAGAVVPIAYDVPRVVASVAVAVGACALALSVVRRGRLSAGALVVGGLALGLAIAGMHYTGMWALRMPAALIWSPVLVAASLVVAVVAATAALWLLTRLGNVRSVAERWARAGAAAVMGLAIAGMHYTGMAAARFTPLPATPSAGAGWPSDTPRGGAPVLASGGLAAAVTAGAVLILGAAVLAAAADRRHRRQLAASRDALQASEARLRSIFEHAAVGIALHDDEGRILEANRAYEAIVGYSREELRSMRAADLSPLEDAAVTREPVRALKAGERDHVAVEKRFRRKDGVERLCALNVSRIDSLPDGRPGLVGMLQDITEYRALESQLVHRAYHDPLTGLANRARFRERAEAAIARAVAANGDASRVVVLTLDLDGFKLVNDSAGHLVGDALLVEVAARLLHTTRGCDLVARLGGDEFAVLFERVGGLTDALAAADRIVDALARPFTVHGTTVTVGGSIGIARGGADASDTAPAPSAALAPVDALLRDADLALYEAKARGRGQAVVFEPAMHATAVERVALEAALRHGLEAGEFRLVYQPIIDLATGVLTGVEALVRWHRPGHDVVSPAAFIPLAEETGLVRPLGRWVLEEACRQGAAWAADGAARGIPGFSVTVNVSGRQLQQVGFVGEVEAALTASGFPAERLVLELTESTVIHHPELARQRLVALKALGIRLAIDDFGTGYSALSYLRQFPIDVLKIDKSFVDEVASGGQPAALAAAIVALGDALELRTVAEGVESADQAAALRAMGCPLAQGYHFSRPVSPVAIAALLGLGAGDAARAVDARGGADQTTADRVLVGA